MRYSTQDGELFLNFVMAAAWSASVGAFCAAQNMESCHLPVHSLRRVCTRWRQHLRFGKEEKIPV